MLGRIEGEDFGRPSAATNLVVLTRIGWGLLIVEIVQIDGWTSLRPLIVFGPVVLAILVGLASKAMQNSGPPQWMTGHGMASSILARVKRFREG